MDTHPQVSVGEVQVVVTRVRPVDRLFAVDLDDAAVLDVPRVLQLVEDIPGLIFDQQSGAGRSAHQKSSKSWFQHRSPAARFWTG